MKPSLFLLPTLLASGITQAATPLDLPDQIVTASRQIESVGDTYAATTVFTRKDIDRLQPASVLDLLRRVPGMSVTTTGGTGSLSTLSLRGTSATQSLVMIDGQRIGSASAGQASLEFINVEQIERIEVVRGPRSAVYGSDAIGGVVQIFTRQGQDGLNPRVRLGIGSNQTYIRDLSLSGGNGQTRFNLGASLTETAGIDRTRHRADGDQDRDGYRNLAYSAGLTHQFTDDLSAGLSLLEQSGNTEYDLSGNPEDDFRLSTVATHLQWQLNDFWRTRFEAGHAQDKRDSMYGPNAFGPAATYTYNTYRDSFSWLNQLQLADDHNLQAGFDWYEDRMRSNSAFNETERYNRAFFLQHQYDGEQFGTELGWRRDDNEQFGREDSFNAAFSIPLGASQQVIASYGEGLRAPTFNDLYTAYGANPDLQPESSRSYELQWRGETDVAQLQAAVYRTDIKDLILLDPFFVAQNISRARIHGLELTAATEVFSWVTQVSATWLDPRDRNTGNQLPRRPKRLLSLDSDRQFGAFGVGFSVVANSTRYNDPANSQRLPGFGTLEARANWRMSDALRWDLKVGNLLDRDYSLATYNFNGDTYGYRNEGLTGRLTATWTPQL